MNIPLVIFLDDLQWADEASLRLLKFISRNTNSRYLLIIGAYHDNEIGPNHPLQTTIDEIKKEETPFMKMQLFPFNIEEVTKFVIETFTAVRRNLKYWLKFCIVKHMKSVFLSQMLVSICNQNNNI